MLSLRSPSGAAVVLALVASSFVAAPAVAGKDAEALEQAINLFEEGDYLTAQETLATLDRSKLTDAEKAQRDDYLSRVQVALQRWEKASDDLEDAETAVAAREYEAARRLLESVLANEYAPQAVRKKAGEDLRDLPTEPSAPEQVTPGRTTPEQPPPEEEAVSEPVEPSAGEVPKAPVQPTAITSPDLEPARVLTAEADLMTAAGRYAEARRRYQDALALVPGYPEAVEGLQRAAAHAQNAQGTRAVSLIDRIRMRDAINWQRTVAEYRDVERLIRTRVLAERFEQANHLLIRARQIVASGRQYADPPTRYESLSDELLALEGFVRKEGRLDNERRVAEVRRDVETQRKERLRQVEQNRARTVDSLLQQAAQHRKDGDLDAAIGVLRQITVIDPKFQPARWLMDSLEDQRAYRRELNLRDKFYGQHRDVMLDVEEAKIPPKSEITYPDDWIMRINRPGRSKGRASRHDSQLWGALDRPIPVDFQREPFEQVIERLADAHHINVIVNWNDLKRVGVRRDAPIDLTLPGEITLKKAFTEVLAQAGGDVDLGFEVADGVITIATKKSLDGRTYMAVYDINDLLMVIPRTDNAPMTDLRQVNQRALAAVVSQRADLPWRYGDDDDDEPEADPDRTGRVSQVIELIENQVAPDSWRDRGGVIGTIDEINGQLVITQNTSAHRQISGLLSKLREERAIQIAVEAIFLTISNHYLEELGMNLNIILNSGNAGFDFIPEGTGPMIDPIHGSRLLLPRTFSRLGFTQATPAQGDALDTDPDLIPIPQPFGVPSAIPRRSGGASGSRLTPVPVINNILDFTNPGNLPSDIPGSFGGQEIGPALSVFGSFLDNIQVDFLIRATQADSRSTVLTAPRVVVFNGYGAWVAVTLQQNFVSSLDPVVAQAAAAVEPIIGTIDAGVVLNIAQATVTADRRYVMMVLNPGVTRLLDLQRFEFSGGSFSSPAFVQTPTLSSMRIQTAVSVPDGGTLLIGGQKLASEAEIDAGVPILSKIPILKRFYSARSAVKDEQTLLILIKPKILIQSEQEELAFPSFNRP